MLQCTVPSCSAVLRRAVSPVLRFCGSGTATYCNVLSLRVLRFWEELSLPCCDFAAQVLSLMYCIVLYLVHRASGKSGSSRSRTVLLSAVQIYRALRHCGGLLCILVQHCSGIVPRVAYSTVLYCTFSCTMYCPSLYCLFCRTRLWRSCSLQHCDVACSGTVLNVLQPQLLAMVRKGSR